ncbi:MAG: hypothetical protein EGQ17_01720 [Lachnospiraceae bacterium]|nr:hypothetical protein [Lachnospiraceae bacterium]
MVHLILSMGIIIIKHYITEVEKQNRFYEKNCAKSLYIYDRRMYIDNFQFVKFSCNIDCKRKNSLIFNYPKYL